ncbi:MAG: hypothetical protein AB7S77_04680 [Desulfatirhabdiaceae bacterium]
MRTIKKIVLISVVFLCGIAIIISMAGVYLYAHPDQIKPAIEQSLSAATGYSCTIDSISFSLKPIVFEATGIMFHSLPPQPRFILNVSRIRADMAIDGAWADRTLLIKNLQIHKIFMDLALPFTSREDSETSFPAKILQAGVRLFLFREIRFQAGEIIDGHILASWNNYTVMAQKIQATAAIDSPVVLSFAMNVKNPSQNMQLTASDVNFVSDTPFDLNNPGISGLIKARDIHHLDSRLNIPKMEVQSRFTYQTNRHEITISPLKLDIGGLAIMNQSGLPLSPVDLHLQVDAVSVRYPLIGITNAALHIPRIELHTENRNIPIDDIHIHSPDGRIDIDKQLVAFPHIRCDTADLKNMSLAVGLENGKMNMVLAGENIAFSGAAAVYPLLPPDWDAGSKNSIRIQIAGAQTGPWQVNTKLILDDLAFNNRVESMMGENVSLMIETESHVDLKQSRITFAANSQITDGEALFDQYYLNFSNNPITMSCDGTYQVQKRSLQLSKFRFDLKDILPIEIQDFRYQIQSTGNPDFTATIRPIPLKPVFHHLLQEPHKTEKPFLADIETDGIISAEFSVTKTENVWRIIGRFGWRDGRIAFPDRGVSLNDIHLDLPVWCQTGLKTHPDEGLKGRLAVGSVVLPPLPEQPLDIPLNAGPNRISVDSPVWLQTPGGDIGLDFLKIDHLWEPDLSFLASLTVDQIDLQALLGSLGHAIPKGALTGKLDTIRYEHNTVTSQGEMVADIFGGKMIFSDLGASGILTPAPIFRLNAHWNDLLLAEITKDTNFGQIEGVMKGHIRDFEIAWGQPQKFDLLMETVQKRNIPQTISIRAVDNIAQIGGGQSPFMGLAGVVASVFEKFSYEKIGIRGYLENDIFTINGTIREGNTEYLVKRRGFSGINIVNQNPDNRISFRDMLKRIQRISQKDGAVIE